jgi:uncharacterized membrane protein YeaQ/YmgE (transglycosylase-associated protein family)
MGILATIVVGLIAGLLASLIMKAKGGILIDLILGVAGGFVGGWLSTLLLGVNLMSGINIPSILVALVGAIIVLFVYRLIFRRRR